MYIIYHFFINNIPNLCDLEVDKLQDICLDIVRGQLLQHNNCHHV